MTQINVLDTLGLISTSFGDWQGVPGGEHVELTDRAAGRHLSLQFKDDVLVGCNSIGWTEHVGVMRGLVEGQVQAGRLEGAPAAGPDPADGGLHRQRPGRRALARPQARAATSAATPCSHLRMKITFKLFATLTDYLPPRRATATVVELDVAPDATISQIIEPFGLPPKLVHLVLVNGTLRRRRPSA